jgi:hypothetical protein
VIRITDQDGVYWAVKAERVVALNLVDDGSVFEVHWWLDGQHDAVIEELDADSREAGVQAFATRTAEVEQAVFDEQVHVALHVANLKAEGR